VIEHIEGLHTNVKIQSLMEGKTPLDGSIQVPEAWRMEKVPSERSLLCGRSVRIEGNFTECCAVQLPPAGDPLHTGEVYRNTRIEIGMDGSIYAKWKRVVTLNHVERNTRLGCKAI